MAKQTYLKRGLTATWDQYQAAVMDLMGPKMENNVFNLRPALAWMMDRKDTYYLAQGGEQFVFPLEVGKNPNGGWMDPNEGLSLDDYDPLDAATYWEKWIGYGIRNGMRNQAVNRGKQSRFNLIEMKIKNTEETMRDDLSVGLWGNGSGKQMNGLQLLIPAVAGASQSAVGGISPATYNWWRTQYISMSGLSALTDLENKMLNLMNTINTRKGQVDAIFTDQTTYETYEKNQREFGVLQDFKFNDANFKDLPTYKRKPIFFDENSPSGEMRFVDARYIKFCIDPQFWFVWTDWKEPVDVPFTKHRQMVGRCQLVRTNARCLGCIGAISE